MVFTQSELERERWADIEGCEGTYQVSSLGRIRGLPRKVSNHTGVIQLGVRYINGHPITKGYIQVLLSYPKRKLRLIHVLVAKAFIPNPDGYPQVNHINGIKSDNRVENLEWCNNSMNQKHAYKMGLNKHSENSGRPKIPIRLIDNDGNIVRFSSVAEAERFLYGKKTNKILYYLKKGKKDKTVKKYRIYYDD